MECIVKWTIHRLDKTAGAIVYRSSSYQNSKSYFNLRAFPSALSTATQGMSHVDTSVSMWCIMANKQRQWSCCVQYTPWGEITWMGGGRGLFYKRWIDLVETKLLTASIQHHLFDGSHPFQLILVNPTLFWSTEYHWRHFLSCWSPICMFCTLRPS